MKAIDIEIDDHDIEVCHRIDKSKKNSKETIAPFCNKKKTKRVLYNKNKLASSKYQQLVQEIAVNFLRREPDRLQ